MGEPEINLPISQFAYDLLIEEIADKLHSLPSQKATETEFYHALGFTDEEIAASRERVKHHFPQP
jgi:hypothetical protein